LLESGARLERQGRCEVTSWHILRCKAFLATATSDPSILHSPAPAMAFLATKIGKKLFDLLFKLAEELDVSY